MHERYQHFVDSIDNCVVAYEIGRVVVENIEQYKRNTLWLLYVLSDNNLVIC